MIHWLKENRWIILGVSFVVIFAAVIFTPKPSLEKRLFKSAKDHSEKQEWRDASDDFERIVHYAPQSSLGIESARLGAGISLYELKDYPRAIFFFRHIVRHGQKNAEVRWAQQKLAEIYYEKLTDYPQAIVEYQRLLEANPEKKEGAEFKLKLGRAYFYLGNFDQAIAETSEFLDGKPEESQKFDFLMLKADSLLAEKKLDEALEIYSSMEESFKDHPELYEVKLNKSLAYEEKKDWDQAIEELEAIRNEYPHPDVIALKIKSIEHRKAKKRDL